MNCILHIGAGKCGSSSLQAALSQRAKFAANATSHNYEYVCIGPRQSALHGNGILTHSASGGPYGYTSSTSTNVWAADGSNLGWLRRIFAQLADHEITPILSSEAWINEDSIFTEHNILPRLGLSPKVIVFVRPQVQWINSAWWQWGAWSGHEFNHWLEISAKRSAPWVNHIRRWQQVPGVTSVEVYSATRDVVTTFFGALEAPVPKAAKTNTSLDKEILRFLQRNREFRPHEHASAIDFVLQRNLISSSDGTPWVIPHSKTSELIEYYREQNKELLNLVSGSERKLIEKDPLWWDAGAYQDREVVSPEPPVATVEEVEALTRRAIRSVIKLDERLRLMRPHVAKDKQLSIAQEQIEYLEHLLAVERVKICELEHALAAEQAKFLPKPLRKAISINGIRGLLGL